MKSPSGIIGDAAKDLKYLLDRGYNRDTSLDFITGRYQLKREERNLLYRYVFSDKEIERHRSKLIPLNEIRDKKLVIDAYNVLITVEAIIENERIIEGMDGFLRDYSGVFSNYRFSKKTEIALYKILKLLIKYKPNEVLFIFDSQISKSGELAEYTRSRLMDLGMRGDARTSKSADKEIIELNRITATTDTVIIENVDRVVDIGGKLL